MKDEELKEALTHIKVALESLYGECVRLGSSTSSNLIIAEKAITYLNKTLK